MLYERDVHLYWHAEAESLVRAVTSGAWPVWDPTLGFGQPFLANSSAQVLYPMTWLNLLVRPWWYYTLFVLAHLVLSGAGAYLAGRRLECSRFAALVGAMSWTAAGPLVSLTTLWHHFAGAAWLPWIFFAAHLLGTRRTARAALLLAMVLGMQLLAGSFDMAAMGAFLAAAVILHDLAWPRPWRSASDRRVLALAAGALALALGLSAGQWMATLETAVYSGRRALSREIRTYWSVHPVTLADFVLPGFSGSAPVPDAVRNRMFEGREPFMASLYLGLPGAGLVLAAFVCSPRRRIRWLLAAAAVAALLVSLGKYLPVYDVLVAVVPPLKALRYPVKATVLVALPWCLLAAIGADAWRRNAAEDPRGARRILAGTAVLFLLAAVTASLLAVSGSGRAARNAGLAAGLALVTVAAAAWRTRPAGRTAAPAVLAAALAVADLVFYHRSLNAVSPVALYTHRPEVVRVIAGSPQPRVYAYDYSTAEVARGESALSAASSRRLQRVPPGWALGPAAALAQQMALTPITGSRWGLRGSFEVDYTGLFPSHVNLAAYMLRTLEGMPAHRRLLQLGGVTHVVALHEEPFADLQPVATVPGFYDAPIRVFAVPAAMPHTYVATRTRAGEGVVGLQTLVDPAFDFRAEALIPASAPPAAATSAGASRVLVSTSDRMKVEVDAPDGGYLVVLDSYAPGWRATVDGRQAEVVPANVLFRGIRLPPGARSVELVYRPPGLVAGLIVSALCIPLTIALAWWTSPSRAGAAAP